MYSVLLKLSFEGVAICTLYGILINKLHASGDLPSKFVPNMFDAKGKNTSFVIILHFRSNGTWMILNYLQQNHQD